MKAKYKVGDVVEIKHTNSQFLHIVQVESSTDENGTTFAYLGRVLMGTKDMKYIAHGTANILKFFEMELKGE